MSAAQIPRMIGPYRIVRVLGSGAAGVVFEAAGPGEPVALKVFRIGDQRGAAEQRARMRREAELLRDHPHPDLVAILDGDLDAHPPYLVFPLLTGGTLDPFTEPENGLPAPRVLAIAAAVARALAHLHARGVVHRDVKPANVLLDGAGRAFLGDLGMGRGAGQGKLTSTGAVVGTPLFLPPEVLADPDAGQGAGGDVYALGLTLAWLLACESPVRGIGHLDVPWARIRGHRIDGLPRLVGDLLTADPEGRPDAAEAAVRLGELAGSEVRKPAVPDATRSAVMLRRSQLPTSERPPPATPPEPPPHPARRAPLVIFALLLVGSLGLLVPSLEPPPPGPRLVPVAGEPPEGYPAPDPTTLAAAPELRRLGPRAVVLAGVSGLPGAVLAAVDTPVVQSGGRHRLSLVAIATEGSEAPAGRFHVHAGGPYLPELRGLAADPRGAACLLAGPLLVLLDVRLQPRHVLAAEELGAAPELRLLGLTPGHAWLARAGGLMAVSRGAAAIVHELATPSPVASAASTRDGLHVRLEDGAWFRLEDPEAP